jgi:hypothetical protein
VILSLGFVTPVIILEVDYLVLILKIIFDKIYIIFGKKDS